MFYPDAVSAVRQTVQQTTSVEAFHGNALDRLVSMTTGLCRHVFSPEHLGSKRFFGFLYLVLCIGSHMAPSRSDYAGAKRGVLIFLALMFAATLMLAFVIQYNPQLTMWLEAAIGALVSLLILTVILCAVASALVHVVTHLFPVRFEHI